MEKETFLTCVVSLLLWNSCIQESSAQENGSKYQRFCFIDSRAQYRAYEGEYSPAFYDDVTLCTHLVYTYAAIDVTELSLAPDGEFEESNYQLVTALKEKNPQLKVLLGVGGPSVISDDFPTIVNDTESMEVFIQNTAKFLHDRYFDGIMLDWMYPGLGNSLAEDVGNYTELIANMLIFFESDASSSGRPRLMLTVAVSGDRTTIDDAYQIDLIAQNVDYLLVKTYDFYTASLPIIGHHSALYPRQDEKGYVEILNVDFAVQYLIYLGVPRSKLIMGISAHGRSLKFVNATDQTQKYFGFDHGGAGEPGQYTQRQGFLAYYEICSLINKGWTVEFDVEHQAPYAYSDSEIVMFDDIGSVVAKVNYIKDNKLAGAFISSLADDDFNGYFCGQGPYPLAQALKAAMFLSRDNCHEGTYGAIDEPGCFPCSKGSYQPQSSKTSCIPCPDGTTTLGTGTDTQNKCVADCPSGTEYSHVRQTCDKCSIGFARDASVQLHCEKCRPGYTTVASGSDRCVLKPDDVIDDLANQVDVTAVLVFDVVTCENKPVIVAAIEQMVSQIFAQLSQYWPSVCHQQCVNIHTSMLKGCESGRTRIDSFNGVSFGRTGTGDMLETEVLIKDIPVEANGTDMVRMVDKILEEALHDMAIFSPLRTYGITYKGVTSLTTQVICQDGFLAMEGTCVPCPVGHYYNATSKECHECPVGTYQSTEGMTSCTACQDEKSTRITAATSLDHCISPCDAKPNYCYNGGTCHYDRFGSTSLYCECALSYVGDRCEVRKEHKTYTGVIVGASVGAVIAFLLLVLIITACMACIRYSKVKKRSLNIRKRELLGPSPSNVYASWPGKAYASSSARGVKFVDYIDYYTWLYSTPPMEHLPTTKPSRAPRRPQGVAPSVPLPHHEVAQPSPPAEPAGTTMLNGHAKLPNMSMDTESTKSGAEMIY